MALAPVLMLGQTKQIDIQYNLPDVKFMRVASVTPTSQPIRLPDADGCEYQINSTDAGAKALAQCKVKPIPQHGRSYIVRHGTVELKKNPFGDFFKVRWDDSTIILDQPVILSPAPQKRDDSGWEKRTAPDRGK